MRFDCIVYTESSFYDRKECKPLWDGAFCVVSLRSIIRNLSYSRVVNLTLTKRQRNRKEEKLDSDKMMMNMLTLQ